MKQRLTYALASSAACIALAAWLVPYAPTPKAEGIGQIEVLGTIQGQYSAYVTRWLDTDEVRQLLPQIKMNSIPEILGRYPEGRLTYWIKTDYNGEPLYLYYYPPEFYVTYNGRWMHRPCSACMRYASTPASRNWQIRYTGSNIMCKYNK